MCGRFTLRTPLSVLMRQFGISIEPDQFGELAPRYNIAPTQTVLAVRQPLPGGPRQPAWLAWGLVPSWADSPQIGSRMINARAETVHEKPAFRRAFRRRRCLVPADGYYEWQKTGGRAKQAYFFHRRDDRPFALAGLWEHWQGPDPEQPAIESCTLITTEANAVSRPVHDRMPVVLAESDYALWLDPQVDDPDRLRQLLLPLADDLLVADPVSSYVNKPTNDGPQCIEPAQ